MLKFAVTGPESTGKTTLCMQLANKYGTHYVPEIAREFCEKINRTPTLKEILDLIELQKAEEQKLIHPGLDMLFLDTDYINFKIWIEEVYKQCHLSLDAYIRSNRYDLYLLCNTEVDWENDGVRVNNHNREYLFNKFIEELDYYKLPYIIITGTGENRLNQAIAAINSFL